MAKDEEELVLVHEDRLDEDLISQPKLVLKYGKLEADARHEHAQAKAYLEATEATLSIDIRAKPEKYDFSGKPTEAAIQAAIIRSQDYQDALAGFHEAKHKLDVLSAVLSALEHRKKSLEGLISLHAQSYFSEVKTRGASREVQEDMTKQAVRRKKRE